MNGRIYMQILKVSELVKNTFDINNNEFEEAQEINIDFSNVKSIDFSAVKMILKLQKVALLNNKSLSISNAAPDIKKALDVTGLNKVFENFSTNPNKKRSR